MKSPLVFSYAGHYHDNLPILRHDHRGAELVLVTEGQCETEFADGTVLPGRPGTVFVTPPELEHIQRNTPDCETLYAVMEVSSPELDLRLRTVETGDDPLLRQWFLQLQELNRDYAIDQASALLWAIWLRLGRHENRAKRTLGVHRGLQVALRLLDAHYAEPFTVVELARQSGVSPSHLNSLFRKTFGMGPLHYLASVRMRQARRLLLNPYYNVTEVGRQIGYPDANYFARAFRAFHGVTPSAYRKNPALCADTRHLLPYDRPIR